MHVHLETGDPGLDAFNELPADAAEARLLECLAVPRWAGAVSDGRPYPNRQAVRDAATAAGRDLTDDEVDEALARHPRIGERPAPEAASREAGWSRSEQGGVDAGDPVLAMALRAGNLEYERRFGRVFLIRAAGRSGPEILEALNARLLHDYTAELAVVRRELTEIAVLRLEQVLTGE
jgi:2-oxo-4-hydroxy-4-carboxy-5-ureidoimidazoline decarboxylase